MSSPKHEVLAKKARRRDICREYYARHAEKLRAKAKLRMREYVPWYQFEHAPNKILLTHFRHRERRKAASLKTKSGAKKTEFISVNK